MSQEISQSEWDSVYYDGSTGDFVTIDVGEETVKEMDAFDGSEMYECDYEEFDGSVAPDLWQINENVLDDPVDVIQRVVMGAWGDQQPCEGYHSWDIQFALRTVDMQKRDLNF